MKTDSNARLINHLEAAAAVALHVQPAYIAQHRDGLRAIAPSVPALAGLCREAADFIQLVLDAKHGCANARFAGYSGAFGEMFNAEFTAAKPAAKPELAARLMADAALLTK